MKFRTSLVRLVYVAAVVIGICLASDRSYAQGGATGAVSGVIVDMTGAVLQDSGVVLQDAAGLQIMRKVVSDSRGDFIVPLLPAGTYDATISAPGFATEKVEHIEVRVTETTRITVTLRPQTAQSQVNVVAQVTTVETNNATTGQTVTAQTISNLPLATRNFQQLLTLSAGASSNLNQSASLGRGDVRIDVNGQREDNNNYMIEGITATDYNVAELTNTPLPSPDAVEEFRVQTSMYDATQGRNGGGNINAILKTGTARFHGSLFEFFRNDVLNANEWFQKNQGNRRPSVKQNIFGGSIGGPIGPSGKLGFFFGNYQGTRQVSGLSAGTFIASSIPVLPSDRSADSLAAAFFPNSGFTGANIDPVAVKLLNLKGKQFGNNPGGYLIPSGAGAPGFDANGNINTGSFSVSNPGHYTDDQFTANYDRDFRAGADKFAARFFYTNFQSKLPYGAGGLQASLGGGISPSDLNFPLVLPVHDRFLNVTETHIFTPSLINEFRFGYVRIDNHANNVAIATAGDLGIDRPTNNVDPFIYKFTFNSSGFQIGPTPGANSSALQNNLVFLDTASYTHGRHFLRVGGEYDRVNLDKVFPQVFNGQLYFSPGAGYTDNTNSLLRPEGDFQTFLLGEPAFTFGGGGVANHQYRSNNYSVFAQDDYRITPSLTFNLGLRWELMGAIYDKLDHIGNTVAALAAQGKNPYIYPKGVNKLNIPGLVGTASETTMNNNFASDWGPRFGFAYDVAGKHTTSIRGGAGIYYVKEDVGTVDQLSFIAPFTPIVSSGGGPLSMTNIFAVGVDRTPPGGSIDPSFVPAYSHLLGFVDSSGNATMDTTRSPVFDGSTINLFGLEVPRRFVSPSTAQWNLIVQQSLRAGWVLEVGYVGTKGTHLRETRDANQPYDARTHPVTVTATDGTSYTITQNTAANANARVRALGLSAPGYQLFADDALSNYNAFQATLSHRYSNGLGIQAAYTWSKTMDETSTGNTALNSAVNDQSSLVDSYGLADYDRTHRLIVNYTYALPFFSAGNFLEREILGGWIASGITTLQSGTPFTVLDSSAGSAFGLVGTGTPTTPDIVTSISAAKTHGDLEKRLTHYVNYTSFAPAPSAGGSDGSTGFGNLGRNTFRGPRQQNWDFSLAKTFAVYHEQQVRFTADAFNLFNHPVFSSPAFLDIESKSNFGAIASTQGTPRLIQFALRYSF